MKFNRTPRLHVLLLLRQLLQCGIASSHLRWRSRHVKHPVRTLFGLLADPSPLPLPSPSAVMPSSALLSVLGPTFLTFLTGFLPVGLGGVFLFRPAMLEGSAVRVVSDELEGEISWVLFASGSTSRLLPSRPA